MDVTLAMFISFLQNPKAREIADELTSDEATLARDALLALVEENEPETVEA